MARTRFVSLLACTAMVLVIAPLTAAQAASRGYQLLTSTVNGQKTVLRWNPCQTITYKVNLAAVPANGRHSALAETKYSIRTLAKSSGLVFSYRGSTTEVPNTKSVDKQSAELIVAWTKPRKTDFPLRGWTEGYGGFRDAYNMEEDANGNSVLVGPVIVRGFVVIDTVQTLRQLRPGKGTGYRRTNLLMHELGHAVGLAHVNDHHQQMYPGLTPTTPAGYGPGDRAGLAKVGRKAGCAAVPKGYDLH